MPRVTETLPPVVRRGRVTWLHRQEAAKRLGIGDSQLWRLIRQGRLRAQRLRVGATTRRDGAGYEGLYIRADDVAQRLAAQATLRRVVAPDRV
jgi:excisionase family DNA binding protein